MSNREVLLNLRVPTSKSINHHSPSIIKVHQSEMLHRLDTFSNIFVKFGPNCNDSRFDSIQDSEKDQFDSRVDSRFVLKNDMVF